MFFQEPTVEQRVEKAVVDIMRNPKYVALAGVLMLGTRRVCDDTPTAKTNGRDEWYGREFVKTLTDAELRFVMLHETYHKLYRHLTTWKHLHDTCHRTANMACDYVINIKIADDNKDGFATAPEGVLLDEKYRGMDSAEVFHLIYAEQPEGGQSGDSGDSDCGESLDSHDWDGAKDMTAEETRQLERDIDNAVRQGALSAGKIDGADTRDIDALMEPEVDWQSQLRQFVQETCVGDDFMTWERPNRRFIGQDVYLPSELSETMNELVIGIDTSMSISQAEVTKFLSEVQGIVLSVRPHILRLIYWDDEVRNVEVYEQNQLETLVSSTKPEGGGCTEPECVSKYIKDNGLQVDAVVMMTDGYIGNWGQWSVPTLWACTREHNVSPVGKTIHIKL